VKTENFNHPDVIWLKSAGGQKLKIENVRAVIRRIYLKPYMGRRKIFVVEHAEFLTEEAQNAFLKTLEEPPADSVIILMSRHRELLLETIVSRCQTVKFPGGRETAGTGLSAQKILFGGSGLESLAELVKEIDRRELEKILDNLLLWFRDALAHKINAENNSGDEKRRLEVGELAFKYSVRQIENIIKEIMRIQKLIFYNVNAKLAFSVLLTALEENKTCAK